MVEYWGSTETTVQIFNGCRHLTCSHRIHGVSSGYVITEFAMQRHPVLAKIKTLHNLNDYYDRGRYHFQDVNMSNILDVVLDDEMIHKLNPAIEIEEYRNLALRMLLNRDHKAYTHLTGKETSIFESRSLMIEVMKSNLDNYFFNKPLTKIEGISIPNGKMGIHASNAKGEVIKFITEVEDYKRMVRHSDLPILIENYEILKVA